MPATCGVAIGVHPMAPVGFWVGAQRVREGALGEHEGGRAGDVRRGHGGARQLHVQPAEPGRQHVDARRHHVHRLRAVVAARPARARMRMQH